MRSSCSESTPRASRCCRWARGRPVAPLDAGEASTALRLDGRPYVFAPGLSLPHKNLPACSRASRRSRVSGVPLLVLTAGGDRGELAVETPGRGAADVRIVGWLDPAIARGGLRRRACVAVPSLVEGFGLPCSRR